MKRYYRGDFMDFDCPLCFNRTTVCIKDEELDMYYCAFCGRNLK